MYAYSLVQRATNAILAPIRVLTDKVKDKVYDATTLLSNSENTTDNNQKVEENSQIMRMYPKDLICEYVTFFSDPTEVYPNIFLGSAYNAACFQTLVDHNIKYIINVTSEISNYYPEYFTYYQIPIKDNNIDSMQKYFCDSHAKILEFLGNSDGNVLVHCYMGASRSFTIVANTISKLTNEHISDVTLRLRKLRPNVNPTQRFVEDLIDETNSI
jgi:protein-tyrosine phosphatase